MVIGMTHIDFNQSKNDFILKKWPVEEKNSFSKITKYIIV